MLEEISVVVIQPLPTEQITCALCHDPIAPDQPTIEMPRLRLLIHATCAAREAERHFIYASMFQDYGA